ncbi:Bacteroidetes-Associated Carbohydrate-binding Often N-terminal [uncultured Caudovirales phage]|uniref:Bacteroidetes-Associated Carbohydrate-binding Often N-terminal n=1 Tax=uncultured Caudovirales phage TaxID=2100421 RepID=A0A6J5N8Z7_9CAUD|nr:Bacteroidetes-Associated Carbohydrate-binding Often N-terminal [uncultured Caudovirales phage]
MKTKIYIGEDYRLLDMFDDETIQVTSKLSDIEKLSSVFNDYSNSFTIPATPNNNAIFEHYYDYSIDNGFNANIRVSAYIEVDTLPFRTGRVQLENVVLKDHRPSTYKITFFGSLRQLSDVFGEDTIDRLDYTKDIFGNETKTLTSLSQFDYDYTLENFEKTLNNPSFKDGNIITPLIAYANRDWNYGTNDSTDISGGPESSGSILETELRPAIRIANILEGIEAKYGISFTRDFFGKAVFNNLFMWMNAKTDNILGAEFEPDIYQPFEGIHIEADDPVPPCPHPFPIFFRSGNVMSINRRRYSNIAAVIFSGYIRWYVNPSNPTAEYDALIVDENGNTVKTYTAISGANYISFNFSTLDGNPCEYTIDNVKLILIPTVTMDVVTRCEVYYEGKYASETYVYVDLSSSSNLSTLTVSVKIEDNIPKMKVLDFFQGIMKMFKLIIRPISETQFYVDTLDGYYGRGSMLNISNYVDHSNVLIERPLIYRTLRFLYQKTENIAGAKFNQLNETSRGYAYGDLRSTYSTVENLDELKVELPFENMLFERLDVQAPYLTDPTLIDTTTNIVIGQSATLSDDGTTISRRVSKPILFFNNGIAVSSDFPFKVKYQNIYTTVSFPYIVGNTNDALLYQVTDAINFGAEIDPWHLLQVDNSLYLNYWRNWVETIYSLKQRKFTYIAAALPARYIQELSLNDRIIIGNNRFKINDFTVDVSTGQTKFTLFNDIFSYVAPQPFATTTSIDANAGTKYYGIPINTDGYWHVSLLDEGNGTDWVEVLTPSGTGSTEIVIRVLEKATQGIPDVYEDRVMTINIWQGEGYVTGHAVELIQRGLNEPA